MTPPSEAPAGPAIEAARPKDFVASDHAYEIARGVRGCTTDEQYMDLQWRIDCALLSLRAQNERYRELLERISHIGGFRTFNDILPEVRLLLGKDQP